MPAEYLYVDDADGIVAIPGRSPAGESLALVDASKFPIGFWSEPARLVVRRAGAFVTILKATGRTGSALSIDGALDGYADATIVPGDDVRISWTRGDVEAIYGYVDAALVGKADASALADYATLAALSTALAGYATTGDLAGKADASALADYATTTALANGLAGKENSLPAGSPGQFLAHDKIFRTPPRGLIHLGRWSTSPTAAGSMGEMDGRLVASPVATVPAAAVLSAIANTTGASVQIAVGGSNLFSGPVTLTGGTTAPTAFTSFALGSIPALAAVKPSITAIGGEVRGFVVDLWGREA